MAITLVICKNICRKLQKFSKGYNSNIWWTVTSKQYALLHIMV